ncbi:pleckstrin homology domain-containing family A member 4 isoform X1 [Paramisgurnus dabryanus]|uniref:pleckstrin homology domain-containing family A member 4 isoform X1 n=2 Tax=Paramisgurnus dabryanus TaxID=90735 RepID=UPI0031F44121
MSLELAVRYKKQSRMEDQDRVSQASSVATVSFMPTRDKCHEKVQTFGKRCQAVKRDPNCPVVIRGWLYKRDSTGLKLWKRRWFVLSNYCLYYYKDSREESVLGSIPLPSYRILYCSPRECRNRKYAFKIVHQGMRPYILSADTQEDMLGWVRALSQSANMEADDIINRRCSSFQDFTQMRDDTEMDEVQQTPTFPERNAQMAGKLTRVQTEPTLHDQHMMGIQMKTPELRGRHGFKLCDPEAMQPSQSLGKTDEEPFTFLLPRDTLGTLPPFPRDQFGLQCHGNIDGWPMDNCSSAPLSPCIYTERRHLPDTSFPCALCYCSNYHTAEHMTLCKMGKSDVHIEREIQPIRDLENDTDVVLTRLCGCDKLLQSLSKQLSQLQADKKSVEYTLEMRWLEMNEMHPEELKVSQKALLQEELVTLRAKICDVSLEMDRLWTDYERMESELSVFHSHLQHILHFGSPQEQIQSQRQLWMMEDILCGLGVNKNRFMALMGLQTQAVPHPKPVSYFEGEFRGHDMDCMTQLEQQDFTKVHQSYTRCPRDISAGDGQTNTEHDTNLHMSTEVSHEPLRLTRVVTSTLPTSLIAERIFLEDPLSEQIPQQSGLKNSRMSNLKKPNKMSREVTDKTRRCRWADLSEERQQKTLNPNCRVKDSQEKEFPAVTDGKSWKYHQQQHEPGALSLTNSESDGELTMTSQKPENKVRHKKREDRNRSAATGHFTDDIHRLGLITANEKETDTNKCAADSASSNSYITDRRKIQSNSTEAGAPITPQSDDVKVSTKLENMTSQQSSRNDIIVIESHSINHVSTLTVFKGHQRNNQTHKPQKKNRSSDGQKFSVSTNLKSECFRSKRQWCELVPVYRKNPKPQASLLSLENQETNQNQNAENTSTSEESKLVGPLHPSGDHEGQNGVDLEKDQSPKETLTLTKLWETNGKSFNDHNRPIDIQPITTSDDQSTCTTDQSKPDQCIYEEIQMISPTSENASETQTSVDDESHSLKSATKVNGEYNTLNREGSRCQEVSKSKTGSEVTWKREKGQNVFSSVMKSSVVNHHVRDCRPRITVVSTSL